MIGVIARPDQTPFVQEFFELFKTPWEFYQNAGTYDVVIVSGDARETSAAPLTLIYAGNPLPFDHVMGLSWTCLHPGPGKTWQVRAEPDLCFPIYGNLLADAAEQRQAGSGWMPRTHEGGNPIGVKVAQNERVIIRIGYDLFGELAYILTRGQPHLFSSVATIECHIDILRRLIIEMGLPLIEIPPVPWGYGFCACLTHDVDFWQFRRHFLDRTFFGFVYRASVGSAVNAIKGRVEIGTLLLNWLTVLRLPLVFLRLAKDFWGNFDAYQDVEADLPSTFYLIPRKDDPGRLQGGPAPQSRSARYAAEELGPALVPLIKKGCEIGLHGIDAWIGPDEGRKERASIVRLTGQDKVGVRMHWLYYDDASPSHLAAAGFYYDASLGYNDAIGFCNGTVQAFQIPGAGVMELPLNIMDTAMFYPDRMNLGKDEAWPAIKPIVAQYERFGGVLTINWHYRSLAPERLWGDLYLQILNRLKSRRVWFATGVQAVSWFNKRRGVDFNKLYFEKDGESAKLDQRLADGTPGLTLRAYKPGVAKHNANPSGVYCYKDCEIACTQ